MMPLRCGVIKLVLRYLIAKPIDVVLKDEVIHLTCVAWVDRWQSLFVTRWSLQIFKSLLLELKLFVKLVYHKLLILTYLDLLVGTTTFSSQENDISVFYLIIFEHLILILFVEQF